MNKPRRDIGPMNVEARSKAVAHAVEKRGGNLDGKIPHRSLWTRTRTVVATGIKAWGELVQGGKKELWEGRMSSPGVSNANRWGTADRRQSEGPYVVRDPRSLVSLPVLLNR